MKMLIRGLKTLIVIVFGSYLGYGAYYMVVQREILYPKAAIPTDDAAASFEHLEKLWIKTSFGEIETWFMPAAAGYDQPAPVLIFFHGNGEVIDYWPSTFSTAQQFGLSVLLVEYPGYGRSAGTPNRTTINETVLAAYDALVMRPEVDSNRIVVYGRSLGGGAACLLVSQRDVAALILQSSFTNTSHLASQFFLPGFLVLDKYNNLAAVSEYAGPVLIFHGEHDETVPFPHAQELVAAAANGELITMECGHSDCPQNYHEFWGLVEIFLQNNDILTIE